MDKLAAYKLDKAYTEGVEITLDSAPDVIFLVKLPSMQNRLYAQALYSGMQMAPSEDGEMEAGVSLIVAKYAQEEAFCAHCIVSVDGEPLPDGFIDDYPSAVAELSEKASEMARAIDEKVERTVKKSPATSIGKGAGVARKSSTESLSAEAG